MAPDPFSVLLGADSLMTRRSGIGRATLEIARALQQGSFGIEQIGLIVGDQVLGPDRLAALPDHVEPASGAVPAPEPVRRLARLRRMAGKLPGIGLARDVRHAGFRLAVRRMRVRSGGRLVYHEPNMIARPFGGPTVVTINDLSWHHMPGWHPPERLEWIERNLPRTLAQAKRIVAISQFTKGATMAALNVPADRIDVVPLAPAAGFGPMSTEAAAPALLRHGLGDRGYVLSTSTLEPRKNFDRLLDAHGRLPAALRERVPLVIAGGRGWGEVLSRPSAELAVRRGHLRLLGHVADADLVALCARCAAFAYVSLYEGFGLPIVEAMASGAAVLASGTTAVAETAGDAALLVDPTDEGAIAAGLRELLEDEALSGRLRSAGLARAAQFSWPRTAEGLVATWRAALA
jgi:glycosyltransferase involved in cell wall biosynthesis